MIGCDHDIYCECEAVPPETAKQFAERRSRILLYPCAKHPRYQLKRKPRVACSKCFGMWLKLHPEEA